MTSFHLSSFILFVLFALQTDNAKSQSLRGNTQPLLGKNHTQRALLDPSVRSTAIALPTTSVVGPQQVTYMLTTRKHKIRTLCWPGNTALDAITKYEGKVCPDGYNIQWESMKTVANEHSDVPLQGCAWTRSTTDANWNAEYLGSGCGVSPHSMTLPRNIAENPIFAYIEFRQHQDHTLCVANGVPVHIKYEGIMCPNDRTRVLYTSMMNVDAKGRPMVCATAPHLTAVWSRTDWAHDPAFTNKYFGHCGVAPTAFPDLRVLA